MATGAQEKQCKDCLEVKALSEFFKHSGSKDGKHYYCKACHKRRSRKTYDIGKAEGKWKFQHLKRTYGITEPEFQEMLNEQQLACSICKEPFDLTQSRARFSPCVDHNHTTGEVRGLLCNHCNRAIGLLGDSPEKARAAADYLEK